jgi:hypothetical protein
MAALAVGTGHRDNLGCEFPGRTAQAQATGNLTQPVKPEFNLLRVQLLNARKPGLQI